LAGGYRRKTGGLREQRTATDWAEEIKYLVDVMYPNAERIILVMDNLNTHKHDLVPALHAGDLVIMDNLRCHKVKGVKEAIQQAGAQALYLPPYSPDFNPIEMMWSKLKAVLRKVKARTVDSLLDALPKAFMAVSVSDICGWFREAGYPLS